MNDNHFTDKTFGQPNHGHGSENVGDAPVNGAAIADELEIRRKAKELQAPELARADFEKQQQVVLEMVGAVAANMQQVLDAVAQTINLQLQLAEQDYKSGDPDRIIRAEETFARFDKAMPQQWTDIAHMDLKRGFMCLRRALTQPTEF